MIPASFMDPTQDHHLERAFEDLERYLAATPNLLFLLDTEGVIIFITASVAKYLGIDAKGMIGKRWSETELPPGLHQLFFDKNKAVLDTGRSERGEIRYSTVLGVRWFEYDISPVYDNEGIIDGTVATVVDIDRRKQTEERLRQVVEEREESYRTLNAIFEYVPEGITITGGPPDFRIRSVSNYTARTTGRPREALIGIPAGKHQDVWGITLPDGTVPAPELMPLYRAARFGKETRNAEYLIHRADGRAIPVIDSAAPILDTEGRIESAINVWREISDIKEAEEELRKREVKYRGLFENTLNGVIIYKMVFDGQGKVIDQIVVDANPAALADLGLASGQAALGEPSTKLFGPKLAGEHCRRCAQMHSTSKPIVTETSSPDGRREYISAFVPLEGDYCIIVNHDVTDLKETQRELARSNADLQEFAHVVSHDLKGPLSTVIGFLALLEKYKGKPMDEKAERYVRNAIEGAERMGRLINDLVELSKVESKGKSFENVDMNETLAIVEQNLGLAIRESKATITSDLLPTVVADPVLMMELLQNLIANAIKFRRPHEPPRVHISAINDGTEWTFSVADNGIGIPKEQQEHIFQMFQRLHTVREYPGTGIGLAIAKKIVERHRGRIWVESDGENGSTFYFTVPKRT